MRHKDKLIIITIVTLLVVVVCCGVKRVNNKKDFLESTTPNVIKTTSIPKTSIHPEKTMPIVQPNVLFRNQGTPIRSLNCESGVFREKYTSSSGKNIEYKIRIPKDAKTNMPLIIWLHGLRQHSRVLYHNMGVIAKAEELNENRFIIIQPSSVLSWYIPEQKEIMMEFIDAIVEQHQINKDRIILTGYSLGAIGAWHYAEYNPDKWAAVVPVSSQPFIKFDKLINAELPIWAFWSNWDTKDNRTEMYNAIKLMEEAGTHLDIRYTEIKGVTHSDMAFTPFTEEFFDWAIQQVNKTNKK